MEAGEGPWARAAKVGLGEWAEGGVRGMASGEGTLAAVMRARVEGRTGRGVAGMAMAATATAEEETAAVLTAAAATAAAAAAVATATATAVGATAMGAVATAAAATEMATAAAATVMGAEARALVMAAALLAMAVEKGVSAGRTGGARAESAAAVARAAPAWNRPRARRTCYSGGNQAQDLLSSRSGVARCGEALGSNARWNVLTDGVRCRAAAV